MFEHFSDRGRRVIVLAQEEARLLVHDRIGTEHLLLALLHVEDAETARLLHQAGVTLMSARKYVETAQGRGPDEPSGHIPFTPRAKKVLELALRVSQRLDGRSIGEPHLLRAILDVPDSTGFRVLESFGVDTEQLARALDELARAGDARDASAGATRAEASRPLARARPADYQFDSESHDRLVGRIEQLAVERHTLADAIRRFGRHDEVSRPEEGCTCGLQYVLDTLGRPSAAPS